MSGLAIWLTAFGVLGLGCACIWLALTLFAENRKALDAEPELLSAVVRVTPWGVIALVGGSLLGGSGLLLLAFLAANDSAYVWNALLLTLGLR